MNFHPLNARDTVHPVPQTVLERLDTLVVKQAGEIESLELRHAAAEQSNSELVKLCIAYERLASSDSVPEVVAAIDEIVGAVIGCEEFALVERDPDGSPTILHRGALLNAPAFDALPCGHDDLVRALERPGAPVLGAPAAADGPAATSAIVPMVFRGATVAVLVLYRVLPQKLAFDALDAALLGLLAGPGVRALRVATLLGDDASRPDGA